MWVDMGLSWAEGEVAGQTTSVWGLVNEGQVKALVGAMRPTLLGPPFLWLEVKEADRMLMRRRDELVGQLHELLGEEELWAEVETGHAVNTRFAHWLGFEEQMRSPARTLFRRLK